MIDQTLQERMLAAHFVIQGFVDGEPACNYEQYLTELLNVSSFFMGKTAGAEFKWVQKQDNGECDAVAAEYSIDYKLFATSSSLQAWRETRASIIREESGWTSFGPGRLPEGEKFVYARTAPAIRRYTYEELLALAKDDVQNSKGDVNGRAEKDVSIILAALKKKKNIFLFYPYVMSFTTQHTFADGRKSIEEAFNEDFNKIRLYRERESLGYETFLSTIYDNKLLIFQDDGEKWAYCDAVNVMTSGTYKTLYENYGENGLGF